MWTRAWWQAAAERALKTVAQTLVALIGANAVDVTTLDWPSLLGIAATAGIVSILTSIGSAKIGSEGPSLADETLT